MRKILKKIIVYLELYCPSFYDGRNCADTQSISSFIKDLTHVPYLAEEKEDVSKGILGYYQCYNELQTFKKYIPHGNHGLTVAFTQPFGPCLETGVCALVSYTRTFERKNGNTFPFIA